MVVDKETGMKIVVLVVTIWFFVALFTNKLLAKIFKKEINATLASFNGMIWGIASAFALDNLTQVLPLIALIAGVLASIIGSASVSFILLIIKLEQHSSDSSE